MSTREVTTEALTAIEATTFDDLEKAIEKGLSGFVKVGRALETIRDRRLYREEFSSFEDYLQERWKISRSYAYRQIEAARVAEVVSPIGDTRAPATESVTRELAPLKAEPEQARQAWQEAVQEHGPKPTAKQVREAVRRRKEPVRVPPRAKLTRQEIQHFVGGVELGIAKLSRALDEVPDTRRGGLIVRGDLAGVRQALDDLIEKIAPDLDDGSGEVELERVTAKFGEQGETL